MADDLYERYKQVLKDGHVAVLRGHDEAAISAYTTAIALAPARIVPRTALAGLHRRAGRLALALAAYQAALELAPADPDALFGTAVCLVELDEALAAGPLLSRLRAARAARSEAPDSDEAALALRVATAEAQASSGPSDNPIESSPVAFAPSPDPTTLRAQALAQTRAEAIAEANDLLDHGGHLEPEAAGAAALHYAQAAERYLSAAAPAATTDAAWRAILIQASRTEAHLALATLSEAAGRQELATETRELLTLLTELRGDREGAEATAQAISAAQA